MGVKATKGQPEQRVKLGHRISELRFEAGMSQIDLAREAGISRAMMSAVENGKYLPTLVSAKSLAKALGTTVDGLIDGIIE